ncbi:MFS transporter [Anaeroselena agilis]|uniref:MFS transporter n=1 Tax=Anaeroselena agilis TaxID=3063788 RepID=A0ABU3NSY7_9FIRM|nr:MFS transporter [Selenomonadales bacterium 4137-cl]
MTEKIAKEPVLTLPLILLAISHAVTDLSQGALPVLLPFLKTAFNLTYAQVGIIVMAQNVTSSVIQPAFGYVADRLSLPWLIPAGVLLSGIGVAVTGLVGSYSTLLAIVIITGLGVSAFHPQGSKSAHFVSASSRRGQSMSVFSVGGNFGMALGTIFMGLLLTFPGGMGNTIWFLLPAGVTALLVWLNLPRVSPPPAAAAAGKKDQPRAPLPVFLLTVLLAFILVRTTIQAGLTTFIPLYYVNYLGGSPVYAGYLLSAFMMAGVVGTFVGGTLSDKFGRKTLIVGSMLISWPLLALFQFTSGFVTVVLAAVTGFTLIASFSPLLVLAQEIMPGYEAMAAGLTIGFSIGLGGIGVTVLGYVADHFGVPSVFSVISVLPAGTIALAMLLPGGWFRRDNAPAS